MCSIGGAGKVSSFFDFDWKQHQWNLWVVAGSIIGGFITIQFLSTSNPIEINPTTISALSELGFSAPKSNLIPSELFSLEALKSPYNLAILIVAGFFIGFGDALCRRLYFWTCNNRLKQFTTPLFSCCYWIFHWRLTYDLFIFSHYFFKT